MTTKAQSNDKPDATVEQVSDVEELVASMAIAIRDVSQGEGFDYMDFCQNAAAAAYAVVARKHAEDAKRIGELVEAVTPSLATKVAYIGEFHFPVTEVDQYDEEYQRMVAVPWPIIKEIMAAILDRAALNGANGNG